MWLNMDYWPLILYDVAMTNTSEFLTKSPHSLISAAAKSAFVPTSRSVVAANRGSGSVTAALELAQNPALDARCGVTERSRRVQQADRLRGSAARDTGDSSGSR